MVVLSCSVSWSLSLSNDETTLKTCQGKLKYLQGDALLNQDPCIGPDNSVYPRAAIEHMVKSSFRKGRSSKLIDPVETQKTLLKHHEAANYRHFSLNDEYSQREGRGSISEFQPHRRPSSQGHSTCSGPGNRLCKTQYNTTAPMYGVSLTSGQPVTIVQKFPDLLQQIIYEVCDSSECDVVHGECVQTYVPYLFLVIPLGPVTLTGQDYVLVENGCVCRPKYGRSDQEREPSVSDALPGF